MLLRVICSSASVICFKLIMFVCVLILYLGDSYFGLFFGSEVHCWVLYIRCLDLLCLVVCLIFLSLDDGCSMFVVVQLLLLVTCLYGKESSSSS